MVSVAAIDSRFLQERNLLRTAVGALNRSIGPANIYHEGAAVLEICEVLDGFLEGCGRVHNAVIMRDRAALSRECKAKSTDNSTARISTVIDTE